MSKHFDYNNNQNNNLISKILILEDGIKNLQSFNVDLIKENSELKQRIEILEKNHQHHQRHHQPQQYQQYYQPQQQYYQPQQYYQQHQQYQPQQYQLQQYQPQQYQPQQYQPQQYYQLQQYQPEQAQQHSNLKYYPPNLNNNNEIMHPQPKKKLSKSCPIKNLDNEFSINSPPFEIKK